MTDGARPAPPTPHVPVSWGELIDKITILEIKRDKIAAPAARANVERELDLLNGFAAGLLAADGALAGLAADLRAVNLRLWDIEDRIRLKERDRAFDAEFIELARSVYVTNDERAALKRRINQALDSQIVEEKTYQPYR